MTLKEVSSFPSLQLLLKPKGVVARTTMVSRFFGHVFLKLQIQRYCHMKVKYIFYRPDFGINKSYGL